MSPKLRLESLERLGWRFGLETIRTLLAELEHPESSLKVIHVAGSNGKGSTCAYMASYLKHCGYKTGLYTSPHLCDIRERFRINGAWIPQRDLIRHTRKILQACLKVRKKLGHLPTHFEALTAIAFSWFQEQKVDWVVLEVGLGGRLDATNVIAAPAVSLITPIGLEHQNILGKTLGSIAKEKAGILKRGCVAATVQTHPEALKVIEKEARKKGVKLWVGGRDFRKRFALPDSTDYQSTNASLAVAGIQLLGLQGVRFEEGLIQKSFAAMRWPGRLEVVSRKPLIVLDGAHNPAATQSLRESLRSRFPNQKWIILNGFLKDKNYSECIKRMKPCADLAIVTEPESERAESGAKIFKVWEKEGVKSLLIKDWKKALELARRRTSRAPASTSLLVMGSFYLVGNCRRSLLGLEGLEKI